MSDNRSLVVADVGAKVVLAALLLHVLLAPDLPQYQAKGMGWRLILYPLIAVLVPILHRLRPVPGRYPALLDLCLVLPFLIDLAGNAAGAYDRIVWWDDAMHVATWTPLVMALGLAVRPLAADRRGMALVAVGAGAVASILWEIAEYVTFVADHPVESASAYQDTIGDMAGSITGSVLGAAVLVLLLRSEGET